MPKEKLNNKRVKKNTRIKKSVRWKVKKTKQKESKDEEHELEECFKRKR